MQSSITLPALPARLQLHHSDIPGICADVTAEVRALHASIALDLADVAGLCPSPATAAAGAELLDALQRAVDLAVLLRHAATVTCRR